MIHSQEPVAGADIEVSDLIIMDMLTYLLVSWPHCPWTEMEAQVGEVQPSLTRGAMTSTSGHSVFE